MKAIWSGTISFGLINIPVNLFSITIDHSVPLHMLHKKDMSPIRFARFCRSEEKEVAYQDIVKAYEYEKGSYVVVSDEDFEKASPKKSKTLEIECFVDEDEVDPIYYEKPYFLEPGKGAGKTYVLLNEALKKSKKVGVVSYVLHQKSHLGLIRHHGRGILLQQLRFHSELRNTAEIELPISRINPKELEVATKLIEQLSEPFKAEKFKDTYHEDLLKLIEAKLKGKKIPAKKEEAESTPVTDIMKQLKASLTKFKPHAKTAPRVRKSRIKRE